MWRLHGPRISAVFVLGAVLGAGACTREAAPQGGAEATGQSVRILLVRHGETAPDGTSDPALSEAGQRRGEALARLLASAGVTQVYTTDYRRTRAIAQAVADAVGIEVESYDPEALADFATELRSTSGVILVVGHSNTTPELVRHLGGEPGTPIEETEFDRLYVVVPAGEPATTVLLRYGG
ncbi:MAG: SixA phosphatase family protein [Longimicrobiales bacterium]